MSHEFKLAEVLSWSMLGFAICIGLILYLSLGFENGSASMSGGQTVPLHSLGSRVGVSGPFEIQSWLCSFCIVILQFSRD